MELYNNIHCHFITGYGNSDMDIKQWSIKENSMTEESLLTDVYVPSKSWLEWAFTLSRWHYLVHNSTMGCIVVYLLTNN